MHGKVQVMLLMAAILVRDGIANLAKMSDVMVSKKQFNPCAALTQPENPPTGMFSVKSPPGGLAPATGDGTTDDTSAIQNIVDYAARSTSNKKVFFPPGEYLVSGDILIKGGLHLHGSVDNISVIKASKALGYQIRNTLPVKGVNVENLFFDGIHVVFDQSRSTYVTVQKCVFFTTASSENRDGQLTVNRLLYGRVEKCIFLRHSHAFGVGSQFYRTRSTVVINNVFGLDLSSITWLSTQLKGQYWNKQEKKLEFLKSHYNLPNDQGFFMSALYDGYDVNMIIKENVFNGSPKARQQHKQDHVVYLKGFNGMIFTSNYARGWGSDPTGGIKARNGENLHIARNYIDDTGILLYSHEPVNPLLYPGLKNVVIYGNRLVIRTNRTSWGTGISYYEPNWRTHSAPDENLKYAANEFEFPGVTNPTYPCIKLTNGNLSEHHVYADNVYYPRTTPPRKVRLTTQRSTPGFESGSIDASIIKLYNYPVYKLDIPVYSQN